MYYISVVLSIALDVLRNVSGRPQIVVYRVLPAPISLSRLKKKTQRNYKPTQQVNKTTRHINQQRSHSHPISVVVTIMFIMLVAFVVVGRWQWLMVVVAMVVVMAMVVAMVVVG